MLVEPLESPDEFTPATLRAHYEEELAAIVTQVGPEAVVAATDLEPSQVAAIETGSAADIEVSDVAAILALSEAYPSADELLAATRDHLLLEMSSAMLTVDRIARALDGELDPKEIQAKIEGRYPMTLDEYAQIHHFIASQT